MLDDNQLDGRTVRLINDSLIWDNHACMPLRPDDSSFLPQLGRFQQAGVNIVTLNVGFDSVAWENTLLVLAHFRQWINQHANEYLLIDKVADIEKAKQSKKLGITFDIEGASALNNQLSMIEMYYQLGVRWMLMAYNQNNAAGGGCQDEDKGLTEFGKDILDEMTRVGMVICCSHTGKRTAMEVMDHASQPVIFSHSNPSALRKHKRNIDDETIKACAETGGVIGLNGIGIFLGDNEATVAYIVKHIDYVVQLVGIDHVGIGLDYVFDQEEVNSFVKNNPKIFPPEDGYSDGLNMLMPESIPGIVQSLLGLGYSDDDIAKILGLNHQRIAEQVWK